MELGDWVGRLVEGVPGAEEVLLTVGIVGIPLLPGEGDAAFKASSDWPMGDEEVVAEDVGPNVMESANAF